MTLEPIRSPPWLPWLAEAPSSAPAANTAGVAGGWSTLTGCARAGRGSKGELGGGRRGAAAGVAQTHEPPRASGKGVLASAGGLAAVGGGAAWR